MENVINAEVNEITEERTSVQIVHSIGIAESLCADYQFFKDLISVRKDKFNEKRRVWFFRRSEEFDTAFNQLVSEAKERNATRFAENEEE